MTRIGSFAFVVLAFVVGGCRPDDRPIPPGVYSEKSGVEFLTVGPSTIHLHIKSRAVISLEGRIIDGTYKYRVEKDNAIHLSMTSNNFDIIEFNWYDWSWRDGIIARVERKTGAVTRFVAVKSPD